MCDMVREMKKITFLPEKDFKVKIPFVSHCPQVL